MPFMYRGKPANIDRSHKRDDESIHENVVKAYEEISRTTNSRYVKILPVYIDDSPFNRAEPEKFLTLYCTKILDLSMFEVEHWLDSMSRERWFHMESLSSIYFDQRRKYYKRPGLSGMLSNSILRLRDL